MILRTGGQASEQMCPRTDLREILKFSRNGEFLCGAWLLKLFEQREGQGSYVLNRVEIKPQKASLEGPTTWLAHIRREDLAADATEFYRVCVDHFV